MVLGRDYIQVRKRKQPRRQTRAIIWETRAQWWYQVRAGNGRIIDASEEALSKAATVLGRLKKRWPGVLVFQSKVGRPKRGFRFRRDVYDAGVRV